MNINDVLKLISAGALLSGGDAHIANGKGAVALTSLDRVELCGRFALQREGGGLDTVVHSKFRQDRTDVMANGFAAERQFRGDFDVVVASCNQDEYFAFTPAQTVWVSINFGPAATVRSAAQRYEALLGALGRRTGAQCPKGGQRRFHTAEITAELGDGGLVVAAAAGPFGSGGLPVAADLQLKWSDRTLDGNRV